MTQLQFSFLPENLKATADYLVLSPHFPTNKQSEKEIEDRLKNAAIASFSKKYCKVQSGKGAPLDDADIEQEVLEGPVLWRGIGALFCPVASSAVDGAATLTVDMPFVLKGKPIVSVTFLVVLR